MHMGRKLQFERLLFFSDAVFAIAITLLVIEIHVPHGEFRTDLDVVNALLSLLPNYIGFLISFFVIGRFWIGHHGLFGDVDTFDGGLLWRNLLFLGAIAFLPFPTAVISQFGATRAAVIFYALWLTLAGVLNWLLYRKIATLSAEPPGRERMIASTLPALIGILACLGALLHPLAGLGALVLSPLLMRGYDRLIRPRLTQTSASG